MNTHQAIITYLSQEQTAIDTIILPNRRLGIMLENLWKQQGSPGLVPRFISISDWLEDWDFSTVPPEPIFWNQIFSSLVDRNDRYTAGEVFHWIPKLLKDFSECYQAQVNFSEMFSYLKDLGGIDAWARNLEIDALELSDAVTQEQSMFWEAVEQCFSSLEVFCEENGFTYSGRQMQSVLENIRDTESSFSGHLFYGFNALTPLEKSLFTVCFEKGAHWVTPYESTLLERHYSHRTLKQMYKAWKQWLLPGFAYQQSYLLEHSRTLALQGFSSLHSTGIELQKILTQNHWDPEEKTAIILCDEQALPTMLECIDVETLGINVTMGLSLGAYGVSAWLQSSIDVLWDESATKDDLARVYAFPFWEVLDASIPSHLPASAELHRQWYSGCFSEDFPEKQSPAQFLIDWLAPVSKQMPLGHSLHPVLEETLSLLRYILEQIEPNIPSILHDIGAWQTVLQHTLQSGKLFSQGSPEGSIQMMGMLEARNLQFDRIIFVGLNEGNVPKGATYDSFIPSQVKKDFQMFSYSDKDAIYAYHFFTLCSKAKEMYAFYNEGGQIAQEKSRFIMEIEYVWPSDYPEAISIQPYTTSVFSFDTETLETFTIPRDPLYLERMNERIFDKRISASFLNSYEKYTEGFYTNYVLGLRDDEESSVLQASELGNIVHNTLEKLYLPWVGKVLSVSDMNSISDTYLEVMNAELKESFTDKDLTLPENELYLEQAKWFIEHMISKDKKRVRHHTFQIVGVEQELEYSLEFENGKEICLMGKIDRIVSIDGQVELQDYKTGKVNSEKFETSKINKGQLQFFVYLWLAEKNGLFGTDSNIQLQILGLSSSRVLSCPAAKKQVLLETLENSVRDICTDILSSEVPLILFKKEYF